MNKDQKISFCSSCTIQAGKLELQRIEYIPNSQNKVGEIDHLVVEHLQNGLTLVSFEGKLYEPISPDLVSNKNIKNIRI